ncbi:MAG: hypothetical protein FWE69_06935, partial [Clostridiales bacterium]|nr:hypothetical protein [Clostridiales bacterium]
MKRILSLVVALAMVLALVPAVTSAADTDVTIAAWSATHHGANSAVSSFTATSGASGFGYNTISLSSGGNFAIATANVAGVGPASANQGSSWSAWSSGLFWKMELRTLGYQNVKLNYHAYGTATSPASWEARYSTDGSTWLSFSPAKTYTIDITNVAAAATPVTIDLSVLDDAPGAVFVGLFATSGGSGNNRLCNVKLAGDEKPTVPVVLWEYSINFYKDNWTLPPTIKDCDNGYATLISAEDPRWTDDDGGGVGSNDWWRITFSGPAAGLNCQLDGAYGDMLAFADNGTAAGRFTLTQSYPAVYIFNGQHGFTAYVSQGPGSTTDTAMMFTVVASNAGPYEVAGEDIGWAPKALTQLASVPAELVPGGGNNKAGVTRTAWCGSFVYTPGFYWNYFKILKAGAWLPSGDNAPIYIPNILSGVCEPERRIHYGDRVISTPAFPGNCVAFGGQEIATCSLCNEPWGDPSTVIPPDPSNHVGHEEQTANNRVEADYDRDGYEGDIHCSACTLYWKQGAVIPKLAAGDTYGRITELTDLTSGYYVVVGQRAASNFGRMPYTTTFSSGRMAYEQHYTALPDTIVNPPATDVYFLTVTGTSLNFQNSAGTYLVTAANGQLSNSANSAYSYNAEANVSGMFRIEATGTTTTNYLGVNSGSDFWRPYAISTLYGSTGHVLALYKVVIETCETHSWGDWTEEPPSTCKTYGEEKRVCSVCFDEETRPLTTLDPSNHTGEGVVKDTVTNPYVAPTLTSPGFTGDDLCAGCGAKVADGEVIPKLEPSKTYQLTAAITPGEYVIAAEYTQMGTTNMVGAIKAVTAPAPAWGPFAELSVTGDTVSTSDAGVVWTVTGNNTAGYSFYSAVTEGFLYLHPTSTAATTSTPITNGTENKIFTSVLVSGTSFKLHPTDSSTNQLALNWQQTSGVRTGGTRMYTDRTQGTSANGISVAFRFYKLVDPNCLHDGGTTPAPKNKAATCTEPGWKDATVCTLCGDPVDVGEELPALGHQQATVGAVPANCTTAGRTGGTEECTRSGCDKGAGWQGTNTVISP